MQTTAKNALVRPSGQIIGDAMDLMMLIQGTASCCSGGHWESAASSSHHLRTWAGIPHQLELCPNWIQDSTGIFQWIFHVHQVFGALLIFLLLKTIQNNTKQYKTIQNNTKQYKTIQIINIIKYQLWLKFASPKFSTKTHRNVTSEFPNSTGHDSRGASLPRAGPAPTALLLQLRCCPDRLSSGIRGRARHGAADLQTETVETVETRAV